MSLKHKTMKSYLDLVSIMAKIRKRQSRMTVLCIVFSVFLVTAIFGMADMEIRSTAKQARMDYGEWHISFRAMNDEEIEILSQRPEIAACSRYDVWNYRLEEHYQIDGEETLIAGFDRSGLDIFPTAHIEEGNFPDEMGGVMVDENTKNRLGLTLGSEIVLSKPDGTESVYKVTGIMGQFPMLMEKSAFGLMMNIEDFRKLLAGKTEERDSLVYVKFSRWRNIRKAVRDIQEQFGISDDRVSGNELLLATMGESNDPTIMILYGMALLLSALVATAGILMISSSLNSNIAQRTEFFGLLSCLGADRKQVIRFVRKEAFGWCKVAVPAGLLIGTGIVWILCAILRLLSPTYFANMPGFGISPIGIASGTVIGITTVLLAARAPAKRAAAVSPLEAVSGNVNHSMGARGAVGRRFHRIETALGVHHALGGRKNFALMTSSFAFSIILFLAFSATVDFMRHAINGLQPYTPDLSIISRDDSCSVDRDLADRIAEMEGVKRVYGRMFAYHVPVKIRGEEGQAYIVSYEKYQFAWAEDALTEGSLENAANGNGILAVFNPSYSIKEGESLTADFGNGEESFTVSGVLNQCPFNSEAGELILVCSEDTFRKMTGEENYTIIDIQLNRNASDRTADEIRALAGESVRFSDRRLRNKEVRGTMYSFSMFVYGFLAIIALITVFHVVNSIAMSVSARMKQYGAMRAIGMDCGQMERMIIAEAGTYAFWGTAIGCGAGLPLNRLLYYNMVTVRWGDAWYFPTVSLGLILLVVAFALLIAVYNPVKRVRGMSVVDTIAVNN